MTLEPASFSAGGRKIAAEVFAPKQANGQGVLFIHGWGVSKANPRPFAEMLADAGFTCLTFDLGGMGESEGDMHQLSSKDHLDEAIAAYDHLSELPDVREVSLFGPSYGGYLSAILSSKRPVSALGMRAPADFPDDNFERSQFPLSHGVENGSWRITETDPPSQATESVRAFKGRVLLVESGRDQMIPHTTIKRYLTAADPRHLSYIVMKDAPHSLSGRLDLQQELGRILKEWYT